MAKKKSRGASKRKRSVDPQKALQRKQKMSTRAVFRRIGFEWIKSDGIEFEFDGRTGELDDILIYENIIVIGEYTVGRPDSSHLARKSILFEKIRSKPRDWIHQYSTINRAFADSPSHKKYQPHEFQIFIVYASLHGADEEIERAFDHYRFLDGTRLRYFDALSKTIYKSARHEFFNYLGVDLQRLAERVHDTSRKSKEFTGHVLPESNSGYPHGFKVVSFYADPATLLEMSYVLRRDSWRDDEGLYQRILVRGKIRRMRQYLTTAKRVFVNNIIVTLPDEAKLSDRATGRSIDPTRIDRVADVNLAMPVKANMVGLVDGQHRVFCYHEAPIDEIEREIAKQRIRQNLLVTGLIFPESWSDSRRREFEARLFLEINDTQARAKSVLKQSIEVVLNPFSTVAIAKEITNRLSRSGPLAGLLQTNFFDPPDRIKTSSVVSYGLRPLVKLDGHDSLFAAWKNPDKSKLLDSKADLAQRKQLLREYIEFGAQEINEFLIEAKLALGPEKWRVSTPKDRQLLSTTTINGFFVCIRHVIEAKVPRGRTAYKKRLAQLSAIRFGAYKSSSWKALGTQMFSACFT